MGLTTVRKESAIFRLRAKCGEIIDTEDELVSNEAFAENSELVVQSGEAGTDPIAG